MKKTPLITGKEGEFKVIGKLLEKGFEVYLPVVDVGIDCVIRTDTGYKEIQIKTREKTGRYFFDVPDFEPKDNLFIICYTTTERNDLWIIPSKDFKKYATRVKSKSKIKLRLTLGKKNSDKRKRLEKYKNNFKLLTV